MAERVWIFATPAPTVLRQLHFAYPVVLLVFFLVTFMTYSISGADVERTTTPAKVTGPGGKPLPRSKRRNSTIPKPKTPDFSPAKKALFKWTSVALVLTFLADAVIVLLHILVNRAEGWWCGQHVAVSSPCLPSESYAQRIRVSDLLHFLRNLDLRDSLVLCLHVVSRLAY